MKMQHPRTFWECKTSRVCDEFFPRIANVTIPRGRLQEAAAAAAVEALRLFQQQLDTKEEDERRLQPRIYDMAKPARPASEVVQG